MHQRAGAARAEEADGLPGLWHALHAGESARRADGFGRGRLRRLLSLPAAYGEQLAGGGIN